MEGIGYCQRRCDEKRYVSGRDKKAEQSRDRRVRVRTLPEPEEEQTLVWASMDGEMDDKENARPSYFDDSVQSVYYGMDKDKTLSSVTHSSTRRKKNSKDRRSVDNVHHGRKRRSLSSKPRAGCVQTPQGSSSSSSSSSKGATPLDVARSPYAKYIAGCIGKGQQKEMRPMQSSSSSTHKNALQATVRYMEERKRRIEAVQLQAARRLGRCDSSASLLMKDSWGVGAGRLDSGSTALLSSGNYSNTICEQQQHPSTLFSQSVLDKMAQQERCIRQSGHHNGPMLNTDDYSRTDRLSSDMRRNYVDTNNSANNVDIKSIRSMKKSDNIVDSRDNKSDTASCGSMGNHQNTLAMLSGANKAPWDGSGSLVWSSDSVSVANQAQWLQQTGHMTRVVSSVSLISDIADRTSAAHLEEQASTVDPETVDVQLHSTFNYPLHSTMIQEDGKNMSNNEAAQLSSSIGKVQDDSTTSISSRCCLQKTISPSSRMSLDETITSCSNTGLKHRRVDETPSAGSNLLSVTAAIRSTVKQNIKSSTSLARQAMDGNNNASSLATTTTVVTTQHSRRDDGDGCTMELNFDSDDSCDSSTMSFCVDEESFEGDAFSLGPRPPVEGGCDVCKLMKRQKGTIDLKCKSDSSNDDRDDSDSKSDTQIAVPSSDLTPPSPPPFTVDNSQSQSQLIKLQNCIQESRTLLLRADPRHYSPDKWVGSEVSSDPSVQSTAKSNPTTDDSNQNSHRNRNSYTNDVKSSDNFKYSSISPDPRDKSDNASRSLNVESSDSGRGSSVLMERVELSNASKKPSKKQTWHSTPQHGKNSRRKKSTITYKMVDSNFLLYMDKENIATPKNCKARRMSIEKGLKDSTGKYLNTPVRKSAHRRVSVCDSKSNDNSDYDTRAIKRKLKRFCKTIQQDNAMVTLQTFGQV